MQFDRIRQKTNSFYFEQSIKIYNVDMCGIKSTVNFFPTNQATGSNREMPKANLKVTAFTAELNTFPMEGAPGKNPYGVSVIPTYVSNFIITERPSHNGNVASRSIGLRQKAVYRTSRRRPTSHMMTSNNSNGKDNRTTDDAAGPQKDESSNDTGASASAERRNLDQLLSRFVYSDIQVGPIEKSILKLESFRMTPATPEFAELALAGEWRLTFSSLGKISKVPYKLDRTVQRFVPESKRMTNQIDWDFAAKNGVDMVSAQMTVNCEYTFISPSRLNIKLLEHKVNILPRKNGSSVELPSDMQAVIDGMRQTIPIEFFDPSGLCDISYIEPEYRITRFLGKRVAGIREVFIRIPPV